MRHCLVLFIALILGCSSSSYFIVKKEILIIEETDTLKSVLLKLQRKYVSIDVDNDKLINKIKYDIEESSKGKFIFREPTEEERKTFIIFRCPCRYFYLYQKDNFNEHIKLTVNDRGSFKIQDPEAFLKSIKK